MTTINQIKSREDLVAALQTGCVSTSVVFTSVEDIQAALRLCSDDRFRKSNPRFYLVVNKLGQYLSEFTENDMKLYSTVYYRYKYMSIETSLEHITYFKCLKYEEDDLLNSLDCGDDIKLEFVECSEQEYSNNK